MEHNFELYGLTAEYAENPIGLFTEKPRFSWKFHAYPGFFQKEYRLTVASSRENLEKGIYDLWDSGLVADERNVAVEYEGKPLTSRSVGYWRCAVTDTEGNRAESEIQSFEIGLLHAEDWHGAWQAAPLHFPGRAQYWRCPFKLPNKVVRRARAYVCGLGYHELYLNGEKVGNAVLSPAPTDYGKRVLYCTYDITDCLKTGGNCVGIILGFGWFGARKLNLQIDVDFEDGTNTEIFSYHNANCWRVGCGPIRENSIYDGEVYDARLEREIDGWATYDFHADYDNGWVFSCCTDAPGGKLVAQTMEPIMPISDFPGKLLYREGNRSVYDFSTNIAGWVRFTVRGVRGATVTVRHAEVLSADGTLDTINLRTARATDVYCLSGEGDEVYEPRFTYHGFRYAEIVVDGDAEITSVIGRFVHTAVKAISSFESSDETLNRLHLNAVTTEAANIYGILTDCPQRDERFGWLNDLTSRVYQEAYNFDMARTYRKVLSDIADTQRADGAISDTAPVGIGRTPADPVCASFLLIGLFSYEVYGDRRLLVEHYRSLKAWVDYLGSRTENRILSYSYYGDWVCPYPPNDANTPNDAKTPGELISAAYYYWQVSLMARIAEITEHEKDAAYYRVLSGEIKQAFNERFFCEKTCNYGTGSQSCNAVALSVGLCKDDDRETLTKRVAENIEKMNFHCTAGNQGYRHLFYALGDADYNDILYQMLVNPEYPGWGYMIACGATTVWERWEKEPKIGMNSFNHPMFGSYDAWLFRSLGGIRLAKNAVGANRIEIAPSVPKALRFVRTETETVNGAVKSSWEKKDGTITYDITIPPNTRAEIVVRGEILQTEGEIVRKTEGERNRLTVACGNYRIVTRA